MVGDRYPDAEGWVVQSTLSLRVVNKVNIFTSLVFALQMAADFS